MGNVCCGRFVLSLFFSPSCFLGSGDKCYCSSLGKGKYVNAMPLFFGPGKSTRKGCQCDRAFLLCFFFLFFDASNGNVAF